MSKELEELFEEIRPELEEKLGRQKESAAGKDPYGRGKDFDLARARADIDAGFKICTKCSAKRSLQEFNRRRNILGYKGQCRYCDKQDFNAWRLNNYAKVLQKDREKHYNRKYGVDPALSKILAEANNRVGLCPLCRKTTKLTLDHDHRTGQIRNMLCAACNSMLGFADDSIDTLYEAIAYLKKHRGLV